MIGTAPKCTVRNLSEPFLSKNVNQNISLNNFANFTII